MEMPRWIPLKSFEQAMAKAEKLKSAAEAKAVRNSALFTEGQERFRRELRLESASTVAKVSALPCLNCQKVQFRRAPSRTKTRIRIKRR